MLKVKGIGWVKENKYGCTYKSIGKEYTDLRSLHLNLQQDKILKYPIDNFARFDTASKLVSCAIALGLYDAGISYAKGRMQDIGLIATNLLGAEDANLAYFKDYVTNGRTLGRANLFIYTLPSSPLAEAAIHFGFTGPLLYVGLETKQLLEQAASFVINKEVQGMLAISFTSDSASCFAIKK